MFSFWGSILQGAFGIVNFFVRDKERREDLRKQMLDFIRDHDEKVAANSAIRKEYEDLLKKAEEKDNV